MLIESLVFAVLSSTIESFIVLLLIFTVANYFKALFAYLAGDTIAKNEGFLTINPLAQLNWMNLLLVVLMVYSMGSVLEGRISEMFLSLCFILASSYARYAVPVNIHNFKSRILGSLLYMTSASIGLFVLGVLGYGVMLMMFYANKSQIVPSYILITLIKLFNSVVNHAFIFSVMSCIPLPPFHLGNVLVKIASNRYEKICNFLIKYALFTYFVLFYAPGIDRCTYYFLFTGAQMLFYITRILFLPLS